MPLRAFFADGDGDMDLRSKLDGLLISDLFICDWIIGYKMVPTRRGRGRYQDSTD